MVAKAFFMNVTKNNKTFCKTFFWLNVLLFFSYIHDKCFFNHFSIFHKIKRTYCQQNFSEIIKYFNIGLRIFSMSVQKQFSGAEFDLRTYKNHNFHSKMCWVIFSYKSWIYWFLRAYCEKWEVGRTFCSSMLQLFNE